MKRKQKPNLYLLLFCLCYFSSALAAQIEINHVSETISTLNDIYDLEVNNASGTNKNVRLDVSLRKNNAVIYQAQTNSLLLLPSINVISVERLNPIQVIINNTNTINGDYLLDVAIIDIQTNEMLTRERIRLESSNDDPSRSAKNNIDVDFSGEANISGQVASMQGIGSAVPRQYLRAEAYPTLTAYGIPIGIDALYSTEQNAFNQSMNQISLRFDARQFKQTMQRKLQSKVKEVEAIGDLADVQNLNQLKEKAIAKQFPKLKEWEAQLKDPQIQQGLQQLKQLESIDQILASPEVKEALLKHAELAARKQLSTIENEELERLQSFVTEIEKLKSKADQLRSVAEKYEQYKDLGERINKAKKYANKDIIKDPTFLKQGLKSLDLMSKPQEILSGFDAITIGTSYPFYSRLSLSSLSVNGLNVEWNPGKVYVAATYGLSSRLAINDNYSISQLTLPQNTLAAKIGYGSPHSNHIHLTYIDITDRVDELFLDNETKAQRNKIVGTSAQISLFGDNVKVGGEVMASLLTRDKTIETDNEQEFRREEIPLNRVFGKVNNSSSYDVAWRAFTDMRVFGNATKIKGNIEKIGANYYSLGSPNLLNDLLRWKAELRQSFFKNKLSISAYARQDNNNLEPLLTSSRSTTKSYGISGSANVPNWPTMTFSFAPYSQNNEVISSDENFNTNATMLNLSLGYPFSITKDVSSYSQLTFLSQNLTSNIAEIDYNLKMWGITQTLSYKGNSLNVSANYTPNQVINQKNQEVITLNGSASAQLFKKLNASLGLQYLSISGIENRNGYYIDARYPLSKMMDFEIQIRRNIYNGVIETNGFSDLIVWGGIRFRW